MKTPRILLLLAVAAMAYGGGSVYATPVRAADDSEQQQAVQDDPYAWLSERLVTEEDMIGRSKEDLRLLRNTIYARHGYIFAAKDLKEYFSRFSWYTPSSKDVTGALNRFETQNIALIKRYEKTAPTESEMNPDVYIPAPDPAALNR